VLSSAFRAAHPDLVACIRARARERPASHRGLLTLLTAAARHDPGEHVHRINADTLVVAGRRDTILRPDAQRALATRLRQWPIRARRGCRA
jgi:hypothetical protein